MAITTKNYSYNVVKDDSLTRIAVKHGMSEIEGARKIWEDEKNKNLRTNGTMNGGTVNRQLYLGYYDNKDNYRNYNHSSDWVAGQRAYDNPHWIILYGGEKIWIPAPVVITESNQEITGDIRIKIKIRGLKTGTGSDYIEIELIDKDNKISFKDERYIVFLSNKTKVAEGKLNNNGYAKVENITKDDEYFIIFPDIDGFENFD